jgi:glycosyltransferase involved in cell wall biosynthesis
MNKISSIIIVKNGEDLIADCIDSISFSDEIVVVDNGSSDRTAEIAKRMGTKIKNIDSRNFSELRNFGLKNVSGDIIFYIDIDERADKELSKEFGRLKNLDINLVRDSYAVYRKNFYLGNHEWPKQEKILRVFKKGKLKGWKGELHESPIVNGEVEELQGFLLHFTHRDLRSMLEKTIEWSKVEAELRFNSGHPKMSWWRFPRVMIIAFFDSYIVQKGYKAGTVGVIESMYQSFSIFVTYARLWEMQQENNHKLKT